MCIRDRWYDEGKRFGFIKPDKKKGKDVFVHKDDMLRSGLAPEDLGEREARELPR